jgi:hypothetical protein
MSINGFWIHRNSAVLLAADKWIFSNDRFYALGPLDADSLTVIALSLSGMGFVGDNWMMRRKIIARVWFSRASENGRGEFARVGESF